nr:hypothetical protein [Verrucomicrobiota bacterium]
QYDNNWSRPSLQHPNAAFFAHTLPEWHAPLYRSLQLAAQRFARLPNFLGLTIGADNAGYVSFQHTAPPIPNRPWGEAMIELMNTPQPRVPRVSSLGPPESPFEFGAKSTLDFLAYVRRYDASFQQYGYFAEAVREVDPKLVFTTGSFGSSPGAGARGGWPWASIPGRIMYQDVAVQQVYDWNQLRSSKPLHAVALIDRMHSYFPQKRTWALLDNFQFFFGREAFQRACALALTRGIQGLGTNFLATGDGDLARPEIAAFQKEMFAWVRKFGGVYAMTEPDATIGVFFGHHQAILRGVLRGENVAAEQLLAGSHEGKVTEALFLCHAAGWPARVITYQELLRGPLPPSMRAILLVGLDQPDNSWAWSQGLEEAFQKFLERGGRILADEESICPVPVTRPGLRVAAYTPQTFLDATPILLARNRENIDKLRGALRDAPPPVAASDSSTLWAVPATAGDVRYVTIVNQAFAEGEEAKELVRPLDPRATKPEIWKTKANASLYVKPQTGVVRWNTERPIYDLRLGRKLTAEEAGAVDLTRDGFRWYALPPAEVIAPEVTVTKGVTGFYEAKATVTNTKPMRGVPIQITVTRGEDSAVVYGASGVPRRIPLHEEDAGEFTVTATELLTGLSSSIPVRVAPMTIARLQSGVRLRTPTSLAGFATRKPVPLTIALTPQQERDPAVLAEARKLGAYYQKRGRAVRFGAVAPGGVVESLQPLRSPHRYPQWKTIASDLVLFGTLQNNVLLLDQARGQIFPRDLTTPPPGLAEVIHTRSPFVGEYDAVNLVASDLAGLRAAVATLSAK